MQRSRLLYPFAWLPRRAKHHGQKVTRLSDFENWMERPEFVDWLRRDSSDIFRAFYRVFLHVNNMGGGAVRSHGAGQNMSPT